jgi:hypothetical protein
LNFNDCVVDTISSGQVVELNEQELGSLKYKGKCPISIASLIKMQTSQGGAQLSRVTDLSLEFKDSQYQITGIAAPKEEFVPFNGSPSGTESQPNQPTSTPSQPVT